MDNYLKLQALFEELSHLETIQALANWDEATMMPVGAGASRAQAISTLCTITHEKLTNRKVGDLIELAQNEKNLNAQQRRNLELMQRDYQKATCLPVKLVKSLSEKSTLCEQAWRQARDANDWNGFAPKLIELFELVKESATIRGDIFNKAPYDILLDDFSPGVTQQMINPIFEQLKLRLPGLIDHIIEHQKQFHVIPLASSFPVDKQRALGIKIMEYIGFDFEHGRLDTSHHPFCGGSPQDVRITTRYDENDFLSALFGICHETGHACYDQALPREWQLQPIGKAMGMSLHESQSLIIEMPVCRSFEFMQCLAPLAQALFGPHNALTPENLYRLSTQVQKSLIRVEADEVTYPLHVILRYEMERDLFNGSIRISDLPELWHHHMNQYLDLSTQGNDKDGVMQDVHWPCAAFGYFPAYTLGRLIAAQLYDSALAAEPNMMQRIAQGDFTALMKWLNTHIHAKGSRLSMDALLNEATGASLQVDPFLNYIETRYLNEAL